MKNKIDYRMKIAYLIPSIANSGGMERVLSNKANYLVENGYDVTIITSRQLDRPCFFHFSEKIKIVDLEINYSIYNSGRSIISRIIERLVKGRIHRNRLSKLLKKEKFDIVVSMYGHEISWITKINDGSKKVAEMHFSSLYRTHNNKFSRVTKIYNKISTILQKASVKELDKLVVLTEDERLNWTNYSNVTVIHNHVNFSEDLAPLNNKTAIAVGRLSYEKGFDNLINIWQIVNKKYPDWKLNIYGSGENYGALSNQIESLGLNDVIAINEPTPKIMDRIMDSSIYLLTSNNEALPMVLLEAMSYGVPPVAFECNYGPKEIITDGVNGLLVPAGDNKLFADRVAKLIEDIEFRHNLGLNAKSHIKANYTEGVIMKQWCDLFDEVIDK